MEKTSQIYRDEVKICSAKMLNIQKIDVFKKHWYITYYQYKK